MTVQKPHENLFFLILAWVWEIKHSLSIHLKGWRKKDINLYPWNSLFFCLQTSYHIRNGDLHLLSANNVFQYLKKQNQNDPMHSWYPLFGFSKSHKIIMLIFFPFHAFKLKNNDRKSEFQGAWDFKPNHQLHPFPLHPSYNYCPVDSVAGRKVLWSNPRLDHKPWS